MKLDKVGSMFLAWLSIVAPLAAIGAWNNSEVGKVNDKIFEMQQRVGNVEG